MAPVDLELLDDFRALAEAVLYRCDDPVHRAVIEMADEVVQVNADLLLACL